MLDSVTVTVEVPAAVAGTRSPADLAAELRVLAVLDAFRRGEIGSGKGGRLLGLGRVAFLDLCGQHNIAVLNVDVEDLRREVDDIHARGF